MVDGCNPGCIGHAVVPGTRRGRDRRQLGWQKCDRLANCTSMQHRVTFAAQGYNGHMLFRSKAPRDSERVLRCVLWLYNHTPHIDMHGRRPPCTHGFKDLHQWLSEFLYVYTCFSACLVVDPSRPFLTLGSTCQIPARTPARGLCVCDHPDHCESSVLVVVAGCLGLAWPSGGGLWKAAGTHSATFLK